MNSTINRLRAGAFALALSVATPFALADEASDFVDDASAKGIAEIETARLALQKAQSAEVKQFAQQMIDDHTRANQKLAQLAGQENIDISEEATLMDKGKAMVLKQRNGESFDQAYANNQVMAHEQTIEIFRDYVSEGENAALKKFAQETLPKLESHLKTARELQAKHNQGN